MKNIGIVLIVLGSIMMAVTGFNYVTRERVVTIGDLKIDANETHHVEWPPILGGVLLAAGLVVILFGKNKNSL